MKNTNVVGWLGSATLLSGLLACTPSSNVPGTNLYIEAADGKYHGPLVSLQILPETLDLQVKDGAQLWAQGTFEDGVTVDVTEHVYWENESPEVAYLGERVDGKVPVTAVGAGQAHLRALLGDLRGHLTFDVRPIVITELTIEGDTTLPNHEQLELRAVATYSDGTTREVTGEATWSSSDPSILRKIGHNVFRARSAATGAITVAFEGKQASHEVGVSCAYPPAIRTLVDAEVIPPLAWNGAYLADGSQMDLSFEAIHCGTQFPDAKTIVFLVSAGWCPACPSYIQRINGWASTLEQNGAVIVYMDADGNTPGTDANNAFTNAHINRLINNGPGVRVGDANTLPRKNMVKASPMVTAFPTVFVVRTRDMKIIANQTNSNYVLDLRGITANPDQDYSIPTEGRPLENNCSEEQEELSEPNDIPALAQEVFEPGVLSGGICDHHPDYYRISIDGRVRVSVEHEPLIGDLEVYLWNEFQHGPARQGNRIIGSFGTVAPVESFEFDGPGMIRIEGRRGASAPYTLTVERL